MKIAIAGANGRMGRMLIEAVLRADDAILTGALDVANAPGIGNDAGLFLGETTGVRIESDMEKAFKDAEYVIDFTRPEGTLEHLAYCASHKIKMIIGTTGFDENGKKAIEQAAMQDMRPPMGGPGMMPGNGFSGGPGMMPPGNGMPPQGRPGDRQGPPDMKDFNPGNNEKAMPEPGKDKPDAFQFPDMISEKEIAAREKEAEKVKKILTPEQFSKWQKIESAKRKDRP